MKQISTFLDCRMWQESTNQHSPFP